MFTLKTSIYYIIVGRERSGKLVIGPDGKARWPHGRECGHEHKTVAEAAPCISWPYTAAEIKDAGLVGACTDVADYMVAVENEVMRALTTVELAEERAAKQAARAGPVAA